jgi:bifunctional DNA-binding transcriptional regulator/antitoxin component of YhaV-PrlF toxin-antitoxin module
MKLSKSDMVTLIVEELSRADKKDVRDMIGTELKKSLKSTETKKLVQAEIEKALKDKATKDDIAEIAKKVLKKLYRDLSLQHPYIIDRIKI